MSVGHILDADPLLLLLVLEEVPVFDSVRPLELSDLHVSLLQTFLVPQMLIALDPELYDVLFTFAALILHFDNNCLLVHHGEVFLHFSLTILGGGEARLPVLDLPILEVILVELALLPLLVVLISDFVLRLLPLMCALEAVEISLLLEQKWVLLNQHTLFIEFVPLHGGIRVVHGTGHCVLKRVLDSA